MTDVWVAFFVGVFVGANIGFWVAAIMSIAGRGSRNESDR